jgi:hypothetical protein
MSPEEIQAIQDPWELLTAVRELELPVRQDYVEPFVNLVAKIKERTKRDALLTAGREIFRYRMESAREALRGVDEAKGPSRVVSTLATNEFLADVAYDPSRKPSVGFQVYRFDRPEDPPQWVDTIEIDSTKYFPRDFGDRSRLAILLPSGYEEYGSEAELRDEIRAYIRRHVQLEPAVTELLSVYAQYSWIADRLDVAPYLRAIGDFSGGKTTLLRVVGWILLRTALASGAMTAAPVFRVLEATQGALVLDEADFDHQSPEWAMINKILLTGHTSGAPVWRCDPSRDGNMNLEVFNCFGPKVLGMRQPFKDPALESRCINVYLTEPIDLGKDIPIFGNAAFRAEALRIRNKLQLWRFRRYQKVKANPLERIEGLGPRLTAIALSLMATTDDPAQRRTIIKLAQDYGSVVKELRRETMEGRVAQAVAEVWATYVQKVPGPNDRPVEFPLTVLTECVRQTLPMISPHRVSSIVRTLGLKTQYRGGRSHLTVAAPHITDLERRYGIAVPRIAVR